MITSLPVPIAITCGRRKEIELVTVSKEKRGSEYRERQQMQEIDVGM